MNTITLSLQTFLSCISYFEPCKHMQISEEVADAVRLADPDGEICHLEPMFGTTAMPYNLWTTYAWQNELARRNYLTDLYKDKDKTIYYKKDDSLKSPAKLILETQLTEAKRLGNTTMADALEAALKHL